MMNILAIDIGSSSVKAAVLTSTLLPSSIVRADYPRILLGPAGTTPTELPVAAIEAAILTAVSKLKRRLRGVDLIAHTAMSPSWLAMKRDGTPLTPVVTHQDRRSYEQAARIERVVGRRRHLQLTGNRPGPGGISSTTCRWFADRHPTTLSRAAFAGHLSTWLNLSLCGHAFTDPGNASFTGLYRTTTLGGWDERLVELAGLRMSQMPAIADASEVIGTVTRSAATRFGLTQGTPVLCGCVDGSASMLLAGTNEGQVVNVVGSTDVLAVCSDAAIPEEGRLTRALGVEGKFVHADTIAASMTAVNWLAAMLYPHRSSNWRRAEIDRIVRDKPVTSERADARPAGSRTEVAPTFASFTGISLRTGPRELMWALIDDLIRQSGLRVKRMQASGMKLNRDVVATGGALNGAVGRAMRRDWPGGFRFRREDEATLRGLYRLAALAK
jgi:xylulokinase